MGASIQELYINKNVRSKIPHKPGVYIVKVPQGMAIEFKHEPDGFQVTHNRELPNIYDDVVKRWHILLDNSADTSVLYYGRAVDLRKRIMQYVKFGYKYKTYDNHAGGRAIWYVKNNKNLEIEYYETDEFEKEETRLIDEYEKKYKIKPLANAIGGKKS